jgi:DNA helicase-2/ATP-dependent DNA helicase PcrA
MTIHLAKGLEFDRVFVAGCVEGLLPHGRSLQSDAELEEERRLMYVAMTRARKELALSFYGIPSRFLSELPTEKVAFKSLVSDGETFSDNEERYITLD